MAVTPRLGGNPLHHVVTIAAHLQAEALNDALQKLLTAESPASDDLKQLIILYGWQATLGAVQHLLRDRISEVLRSLTQREREVIELRFGLRDGQPRTLDEVARCYGITRERIRQIEARGLVKLRQPLRSQRLAVGSIP